MRIPWGRSIACLGLAVIASTGCATGFSQPGAAVAGGTVTVRLNSDWATLDPQGPTANNIAAQLVMAPYDRLLAYDGAKIVPYLAKSWKASPSTINFTLRTDATCADGTPVTATVVANSLKRTFSVFSGVVQEFGPGPYDISADDATATVTIKLGTPNSDAFYFFADPQAGGIVCPAGLANQNSLATTPSGSGPYILQSAVHGDSVNFKLRPEWKWGPRGVTAQTSGFPQTLVFKVVDNPTTATNLLLTGGLDVASITGPDVTRLQNDRSFTQKRTHSFASYTVYFNAFPPHPTADPQVRRALMAALDEQGWNQAANFGLGTLSASFLEPGTVCYDATTAKVYPTGGPAKAKAILEAAGYSAGSDGKLQRNGQPLVVTAVGGNTLNHGPEYAVNQYASAGITVNAQITDFAAASARTRTGNFDVYFGSNPLDLPVASAGFRYIAGPNNFGRTSDPALDAAVQTALSAPDATVCQEWSKVQKLALQDFVAQPVPAPEVSWFSRGIDLVPGAIAIQPQFIRRVR
jgi:peptide/nickel transport system substrate-binding protein